MNASIRVDLPDELRGAYETASRVPLGLGLIAFVCLCTLGAFCLLKPEIVWQFQHLWSVKGGEPTDCYIVSTRIGGVVCIVMGVVCLVLSF